MLDGDAQNNLQIGQIFECLGSLNFQSLVHSRNVLGSLNQHDGGMHSRAVLSPIQFEMEMQPAVTALVLAFIVSKTMPEAVELEFHSSSFFVA